MNAAPADDARARREGRRAAHAIIVVVAVLFIGDSAAQIMPAVIGAGIRRIPTAPPGSPEQACSQGVRSLVLALDRASLEAWSLLDAPLQGETESDPALLAFHRGLLPEWSAEKKVETTCESTREGPAAWAALLRLRRAQEQVVLRSRMELVSLRRDVAAHLPGDLR
jgi:hypothetical protein